ncbi:MAG: oxygen-dependent tRNA uridine(34) hydroxylase TrhO [Arcticibacter sp.]
MSKHLFNKESKESLRLKLETEVFKRITLSFYRYVIIENPDDFRNEVYEKFESLGILGRVYVANEGINAQISVPEHNFNSFKDFLQNSALLCDMPLKIAVEDNGKSFIKLIVKVKNKVVADGLNDETFDVTNVGRHLSAKEFNEAMDDPNTIVVDMRNHYESEVGHFKDAVLPDTDTFRETLPVSIDLLQDKKDSKILLYCTGGIRCEKASAYLKHHGFKDVNQLLGGIIDYHRQIKAEGLESKFIGKNFVFDDRLGERITNDVIAHCHICGSSSDDHINCANEDCHLLFIQCAACSEKLNGCCSEACKDTIALPLETRKSLRRGKVKTDTLSVYRKSRRSKLN